MSLIVLKSCMIEWGFNSVWTIWKETNNLLYGGKKKHNRLNSIDLLGDLIQVTKHAWKYQSGFSKAPRYCHITLAGFQSDRGLNLWSYSTA